VERRQLDIERYRILFLRAAATLLQPLGLADDEFQAADWLRGEPVAQELPITTLPSFRDFALVSPGV
jgi:hypothetical protein